MNDIQKAIVEKMLYEILEEGDLKTRVTRVEEYRIFIIALQSLKVSGI